jgi:glutamate:GABA antiporter
VYVAFVAGGLLILGLLIPYMFYRFRKPSWKVADPAATAAVE